jgi:hypothetical protein
MPKYLVQWAKTYIASGRVEIEANSKEDAKEVVLERMGDYEGSMQYDADRDYVEAYDLVDNDKEIAVPRLRLDLDTVDHDHDRGRRGLTSPFEREM